MMNSGDDIDAALDRLHAGGWSVGDTAFYDVERDGPAAERGARPCRPCG
jgi:hypothetical protein